MKKLILLSILAVFTVGCGTLGSTVMTDQDLAKKMARQLNTTPDQVTISDRSATANAIKYSATVGGKTFDCEIVLTGGNNNCFERYQGK